MNDNNYWLQRWKEGNIGFHLQEVNPTLLKYGHLITSTPQENIFVPLCGKSLDLIWLRDNGQNVCGIELSEDAVRAFFQENRLNPDITTNGEHSVWQEQNLNIINGDLFTLSKNPIPARYIYDRASLIAFPPEMQAAYVQQLLTVVPDTENILLSCLEYDTNRMQGPPYSTSIADVEKLYSPFFSIELLERITEKASERFIARGLEEMTSSVFWLQRL